MFQLLIRLIELCKNLKQKVCGLEEENKTLKIENTELKERLGRIRSEERFKKR
ncbi:hypothetical protein [Candidatus Wolbachia massiliensis]|uniref:Uncharacterized protein n=1 Tax=Candidatus Wolbachia massiliensis TaxID=1845000 RepID=A0A7M3U2U8_9RICK|nr:hypothetical protein [Candidatus Wolbachia massiliensis]QOD38733.1 hypothetical protein ID128_02725 [Candidatus Wolbachia massiliensis]